MPNKLFIGIFLFCLSLSVSYSESIIDDIDPENENENEEFLPNMSKEKIEKISASKRIYIITNNNHSFQKGDFISLIFNGDLVARALVAKTVSGVSGIKLLRIYSNNLLTLLRPGVEVHVLRGDDSYFKKKASASKEEEEEETTTTSSDEEDLYNSLTLFEEKDNAFLDEEGKRIIKQDNIFSLELMRLEGQGINGASTHYDQLGVSWSYQVGDNIWAEVSYGQSIINDYPEIGLDTKLINIILKATYIIKGPLYSYLRPYIGYQLVNPDSPGAGKESTIRPVGAEQLELELQRVDNLKISSPIFGASVLKRLVPGWFVKANIGSDMISFGFALEF